MVFGSRSLHGAASLAWVTASPITIELRCAGGTPLAFRRIIDSHGLAGVAPWQRGDDRLAVTVPTSVGPRVIEICCSQPDTPGATAVVTLGSGSAPPAAELKRIAQRMLGLTSDLTAFIEGTAVDPDLDWVAKAGAGAMARGATVFEDVIRTVLTTNCSWAMTTLMCERLVEHFGEPAPGAGEAGPAARAFPGPEMIASLSAEQLREQVRVGYRAQRMIDLAGLVAGGDVDLEGLAAARPDELSDHDLIGQLLALPGVGPYAAAHITLLIGRPSQPILDSWTRPKYARLTGRSSVTDAGIHRHVAAYGPHAGLALWLILTRDWFDAGA